MTTPRKLHWRMDDPDTYSAELRIKQVRGTTTITHVNLYNDGKVRVVATVSVPPSGSARDDAETAARLAATMGDQLLAADEQCSGCTVIYTKGNEILSRHKGAFDWKLRPWFNWRGIGAPPRDADFRKRAKDRGHLPNLRRS